jgi:4-hydroxysphinganine ceramide fatty acyl 2-hydroxylase
VYDVEKYLPLHPGGSDMIEPYLGKSIDEPFEENEHTKTARNQFNTMPKVGYIASSKGETNSNESTSEDERNA